MNLGKVILTASGALGLTAVLAYAAPVFTAFFQATGQTTSYQADKNDGIARPVDVPDDGALQRGATLRYKVGLDGTIRDKRTGLIWEVKCASGCGGLHDVDNTYRWSGDGTQETIWDWLDAINAEGGSGYAGHKDWRIPNERELQSLVDFGRSAPAIDAIFNPTSPSAYWSSTTDADDASVAWFVHFVGGSADIFDKRANSLFVRAVRGGTE
jgi:hypothetical protein